MTKKSSSRLWAVFVGFAMVIVGSPCVIAMIHDLIFGTDNLVGALIAGSFFGLIALAGAVLATWGLRKPKAAPFQVTRGVEREVLAVARAHGGRLTTSELAVDTELSLDECDVVLQHLEMRDAARSHVSDGGDIVYVFPHFDESLDKQSAYDPTDDEVVFDRQLEEELEQQEEAESHPAKKW